MDNSTLSQLRTTFGDRMQENVPLSSYTSARIGGPADVLLFVYSAQELSQAAENLWALDIPFLLLGGGSNVLISDKGVRGVVVINRARLVRFGTQSEPPTVKSESGATLNNIVQRAARLGLGSLEWASAIPGSIGGAVYGNVGAFGNDMAGCLLNVEVLHRNRGQETWPVEKMEFGYRTSRLKRERAEVVILSAELHLTHNDQQAILTKMEECITHRRKTQPPGATMGSMFKNPPNDHASRLIETAGLKGKRIGNAQISVQHANFFINKDQASAADMYALIKLTQKQVFEQFGVQLEPEIELIGEW